jgi:hypothetical protein
MTNPDQIVKHKSSETAMGIAGLFALSFLVKPTRDLWYSLNTVILNQARRWPIVAACALYIVAVLLFELRKKHPEAHGTIEVTFGVAIVLFALLEGKDTLTIASGVYVMVRGFDNWDYMNKQKALKQ